MAPLLYAVKVGGSDFFLVQRLSIAGGLESTVLRSTYLRYSAIRYSVAIATQLWLWTTVYLCLSRIVLRSTCMTNKISGKLRHALRFKRLQSCTHGGPVRPRMGQLHTSRSDKVPLKAGFTLWLRAHCTCDTISFALLRLSTICAHSLRRRTV